MPRAYRGSADARRYSPPVFGSHRSIAGSMCNALAEAEALGLDTVQVFTKNQQQWKAKPLDRAMVRDWHAHVARLGWHGRVVSHASYLINLASCKDDLFAKSVDLMTDEIERCEALGIPFLVHHPGSFVGWTLEQGLARIADAYAELLRRTTGARVVLCLESTAGAGSTIGGRFEHLADLRRLILNRAAAPDRVGFCLDTCHMHAAGYDLSTRAAADAALDDFDRLAGLAHVRVLHLNDSKGACASRLDRHEHIGVGTVGGPAAAPSPERLRASGFAAVLNRRSLRAVPKILETPKEEPDEKARLAKLPPAERPEALDRINVARLRALVEA